MWYFDDSPICLFKAGFKQIPYTFLIKILIIREILQIIKILCKLF